MKNMIFLVTYFNNKNTGQYNMPKGHCVFSTRNTFKLNFSIPILLTRNILWPRLQTIELLKDLLVLPPYFIEEEATDYISELLNYRTCQDE